MGVLTIIIIVMSNNTRSQIVTIIIKIITVKNIHFFCRENEKERTIYSKFSQDRRIKIWLKQYKKMSIDKRKKNKRM